MSDQRLRCGDIQWVASGKFHCQQPRDHEDLHRWQGEIHGRRVEITWTSALAEQSTAPRRGALA